MENNGESSDDGDVFENKSTHDDIAGQHGFSGNGKSLMSCTVAVKSTSLSIENWK